MPGLHGLRRLLLHLSQQRAIGDALERFQLTRRLVKRFVAGTRAEEVFAIIERVTAPGLLTAVTYLGENVQNAAEARAAAEVYLELLDEIKRRTLPCLPSLKLTHMGLDLSESLCLDNLRQILERARAMGTMVWIDMESSAYTERTLAIHERLKPSFPNVACVIQAYLRRSEADITRLIARGATVRLCKGAYREPPELAFPDKRQVDANKFSLPGASFRHFRFVKSPAVVTSP